jgi:uncharacterized DUF497 family protein
VDEFEWDEAKAASNLRKHGVSFAVAYELDWEHVITIPDERFDYGERRFIGYGRTIAGVGYVVAFTFRGTRRRIISVRRFGRREIEIFGS